MIGSFNYRPPPPYVPSEYANCNLAEIPEPYKSEVEKYIREMTAFIEAESRDIRNMALMMISGLVALLCTAGYMVFALNA